MNIRAFDLLVLITGLGFFCVTWLLPRTKARKRKGQYEVPPGPTGLPVFGNLFDIPTEKAWLEYTEWGSKYGPMAYAESIGIRILVLNTHAVASDLMEKKSSIYSGRPSSVMLNEMMGWGWLTTVMTYNDRFRKHRLFLHRYLQQSVMKDYESLQTHMTHRLLGNLSNSPTRFIDHIRNWSGASIMKITYGHDVSYENDPFVTLADDALRWISKAQQPGAYLVDFFPWLRYVPDWFPGTGWKNDAKTALAQSKQMLNLPYDVTKEKIVNGLVSNCIMSERLSETTGDDGKIMDEDISKEVLAMLYAAGADTTVSALLSAVLAFVLYPNVLSRAQRELDSVTSKRRLPTLEDRISLPYLEGILREVYRWNPVTPNGAPHMSTADDVYNDYFIPSGTIIIPNQWAMLHDEKMYPDPFKFNPERWLDSDGKLLVESKAPMHPFKAAFGFGRRICPGRFFADNGLFLAIANIAAVFDVTRSRDEEDRFKEPVVSYSSGLISHPDPFECSFVPRSPASTVLIRQAAELSPSA